MVITQEVRILHDAPNFVHMAELEYALRLERNAERIGGSTPSVDTKMALWWNWYTQQT